MDDLKTYTVLVNVTVRGESEEDALDYLYHAIDVSDMIDQDGIVGIEVIEDSIVDDTENDDSDEEE